MKPGSSQCEKIFSIVTGFIQHLEHLRFTSFYKGIVSCDSSLVKVYRRRIKDKNIYSLCYVVRGSGYFFSNSTSLVTGFLWSSGCFDYFTRLTVFHGFANTIIIGESYFGVETFTVTKDSKSFQVVCFFHLTQNLYFP